MKTSARVCALGCVLILGIQLPAFAQTNFSGPADLNNAKVRLAATYVDSHRAGLADLDAQLAAKGSKAGPFHDDVMRYAGIMQDIVGKQGVDFESEIFWELYRDAVNVAPIGFNVSTSSSPVVTPKAKESTVIDKPAAADAPSAPANKTMQKAALKYFAEYAGANPGEKDTDEAFEKYLKDRGLEAGPLHDQVKQARALQKASGAKPGSSALADLLAGDSQPHEPASGSSSSVVGTEALAAAGQNLWRRGLAAVAAIPREKRDVFLDYNLINPNEILASYEKPTWQASMFSMFLSHDTPVKKGEKELQVERKPNEITFSNLNINPPPKFDEDYERTRTEAHAGVDKLLVRLGYNSEVEASKSGGATPSEVEKNAVNRWGAAAVDTPPALNVDARLRNAGISFSSGYGVARARVKKPDGRDTLDDRGVATIMARWNLIQRKTTAKWNQRVGDRNSDGYSLVPYFGHTEYALRRYDVRDRPYPRRPESGNLISEVLFNPTFFGPFFGSAVVGEKLPEPGSTTGGTERPYLVGISLGFGFYDEASPLVYFDVGKTVSPQHGFEDTRLFYGFSFDAIVFTKILGGTRQAVTPSVPK